MTTSFPLSPSKPPIYPLTALFQINDLSFLAVAFLKGRSEVKKKENKLRIFCDLSLKCALAI